MSAHHPEYPDLEQVAANTRRVARSQAAASEQEQLYREWRQGRWLIMGILAIIELFVWAVLGRFALGSIHTSGLEQATAWFVCVAPAAVILWCVAPAFRPRRSEPATRHP